jgi:hypothetical protein
LNSSSHRLEEYRKYPTDREIFISYSIRGRHDEEAVCYNGELVSDLRRSTDDDVQRECTVSEIRRRYFILIARLSSRSRTLAFLSPLGWFLSFPSFLSPFANRLLGSMTSTTRSGRAYGAAR